ncbi:MAG: HAD family phosphatase [Sphingomonas sp.]|nr:HAD family phosphatase [Sphingomonas sp.]MBV9527282.1 HAD family phosphatase [Sphingomonas sp.]
MRPRGLIFDFDGVLLESEYEGNRHLAQLLTELGHDHSVAETNRHYTGLSGPDFVAAIERRIGTKLPFDFHDRVRARSRVLLRDGIAAVAGAVEFVRSLPRDLPRAVASSSSTQWIRGHLEHLGLAEDFGDHLYSGREHVDRGKPQPDIYLHAAKEIGVPIADSAILEDSVVGATGALASGARVIGLAAGAHCSDGHDRLLQDVGVREIAYTFDDVRRLLEL